MHLSNSKTGEYFGKHIDAFAIYIFGSGGIFLIDAHYIFPKKIAVAKARRKYVLQETKQLSFCLLHYIIDLLSF